jgi:hypothetical protein
MADQWNEKLPCLICRKTGVAKLSQDDGEHTPTTQRAPDGFKVVNTNHGPDFHCEACDVAVEP